MEKVTSARHSSTADSNYPERTGSVRKRSTLFSVWLCSLSSNTVINGIRARKYEKYLLFSAVF